MYIKLYKCKVRKLLFYTLLSINVFRFFFFLIRPDDCDKKANNMSTNWDFLIKLFFLTN